MSIEQEIRSEIDNIRRLKIDVGNINNHLSVLEGLCRSIKEEAYQKGVKDGKRQNEKGCEGCMWEEKDYNACSICCNSYKNMYEAKKADNEIKVGDEVKLCQHKENYLVTSYEPDNRMCILMSVRGGLFRAEKCDIRKTGRHFDIDKILEEMTE